MTELNFVTDPPFECLHDEIGDAAFVKATHTIGGRDAMEEDMACVLFTRSVSISLVEVSNWETHVSKLSAPMPDFLVARLPEETNDGFRARVELAIAYVVGRYARGEHKVCVEVVPNRGRVNWVFEHAGVPYGPHLEPGSKACDEATKKRNQDASIGPSTKCAKVSSH
jgi:hypothetical protein